MDSPMFSAIRCWYVPPVINPPLYVDGDALLNYSTQEQDTGITDTDGRTIWQKTITGNIAAAADASTNTQLITGVYGFIKAEGWIQTGDDANLKALPMGSPNYAIAYVYKNAAGNSVSLYSDVHASRSSANNGYRITLWYTKN
jgi:hypothetical protein